MGRCVATSHSVVTLTAPARLLSKPIQMASRIPLGSSLLYSSKSNTYSFYHKDLGLNKAIPLLDPGWFQSQTPITNLVQEELVMETARMALGSRGKSALLPAEIV